MSSSLVIHLLMKLWINEGCFFRFSSRPNHVITFARLAVDYSKKTNIETPTDNCAYSVRDLKIHVYRERLTARDHVTRARRHVWGFELAFWTSRGGFSRKPFTSSFIALNFILCHVQILKSNKVTLFLQIGLIFQANKGLPSVLLFFVERHWS